jgi:uncharacterized protein YdhG (YjbR/CyaY superfamily)
MLQHWTLADIALESWTFTDAALNGLPNSPGTLLQTSGSVTDQERKRSMKHFHSVEEYLSALPQTEREGLESLRKTIRQAAPQAEEVIHYNMPAFEWNGMLVWYAAFKDHIGFYPRASAIAAFKDELAGYKTSKGAIQFPIEKMIPASLVKKIVKFRVKENEQTKSDRPKPH